MRRDCTRCNWPIWLTATTDAGSGSSIDAKSWAEALPPWRIPTMTNAEIYELREWWSLENGLESRDMETGSLLDVFLFLLCFSSLDHGPVQMASAWVSTTSQWRWSFPVRRIRRKVAIELYWSVVGLMGSYECVRRIIVSFFVSLSFPFLLYGLCSPGGLRLKRGIM